VPGQLTAFTGLSPLRHLDLNLVGTDANTDIALLKIEAEKLPVIIFGNSDSIKVGEWVLAVGNPFNLTSTVTAGIVSAKARSTSLKKTTNQMAQSLEHSQRTMLRRFDNTARI
jgi:S1-C subfamily serine protease